MAEFPFRGRLAVLATMHRKERAIAPVLEETFGLRVEVLQGFDTDRFGTFTRAVPRPGTQLETARDLARLALSGCPRCRRPGFDVVERCGGLPCAECGLPTRRVRLEIVGCVGCGFRPERLPATGQTPASPGECHFCNP
jgi:hypothetical protein